MSERPTLADFGFFHELVTRWSDCDMLCHSNNARYFTFDESARLDYFDPMIRVYSRLGKDVGFIRARIECDFITKIHHPAPGRFAFSIRRLARTSRTPGGELFHAGPVRAVLRGLGVATGGVG